MEISGEGLLYFDQEKLSLIGKQTCHRINMFSPYQPNSCYESDYECSCIMINGKTCSVPLHILSSVFYRGSYMCIKRVWEKRFNARLAEHFISFSQRVK